MPRLKRQSTLYWDLAIAAMMLVGALLAIWAPWWPLRALGAIGFALVGYGSFIEPRLLRVRTERIPSALGKTLRIVVVSDPHMGPYKGASYLERAVAKANALQPDLIVLPGDFVENEMTDIRELEPLKKLRCPLGVFAVLGNHDTGHYLTFTRKHFHIPGREDDIVPALRAMGITVLRNEHVMLEYGGSTIAVAGVDHAWMDSCDLKKTLSGIPPAAFTVLLAHNPDVILDEESRKADLIISGHTHAGHFRLPLIGALIPIPDDIGRAYDWGLFKLENGTYLDVSCGIGESTVRSRLFCIPEVVALEVGKD